MTDLMQLQLQLEEEMRSFGIDRYREAQKSAVETGSETRMSAVRRLLDGAHERVVAAIEAFIAKANTGKAGKRHAALAMIRAADDNDLLAHLALRQVLDSITSGQTLQGAAIHLGTLIEDERLYRAFREQKPDAYKGVRKRLEGVSHERHRRVSATQSAKKLGTNTQEWSVREKLLLGAKLIELVIESTNLATIKRQAAGGENTPVVIEATEMTIKWLTEEHSRMEWLSPMYLPCVVPPKPWTTPFDGGYHSGRVRRLTLVKTNQRQYLEDLSKEDLSEVYAGVNALQETPWAINPKVLDVMKHVWDKGLDLPVVPKADNLPLPNKPTWLVEGVTKETMTEDQLAAFKEWKSRAAEAHNVNARLISRRLAFSRMLWVAEKFKDLAIYYPHQLDFRGRIYPVPLYLHPQGNDAQRGLLEFANGCPINDADGELWLAVHGAGCWGVDKVSLEARRQWIIDNEEAIIAAANDPLSHRFWADAEKPWQALAFCFDWAGYRREGYDYVSSLPVQMDGTCNGLQNFSAILRDAVGGAAVNLVPADKPSDIYQKVADVVIKRVEADAVGEDAEKAALARGWLGNITRKVCKRPVMTLAYGAKAFGFKQMIYDDSIQPWKQSDKPFPFEGPGWEAAAYLGALIWECVGEVVIAARSAMDWLQEAARIATKADLPVVWRTPTGFVVRQEYTVANIKRIDFMMQDVRIRLSINEDTSHKLDIRKQASGVSPNWVHSLDASHMVRTINACREAGMRSFCMIHDSYGTHAGNAAVMAWNLRNEFVRMYSERDVLRDFRDDLQVLLPDGVELPALPEHGDLDLNMVLESPFFFA